MRAWGLASAMLAGAIGCGEGATQMPMARPPTTLVARPTAGVLPRGQVTSDWRVMDDGTLLATVSAGVLGRVMVGISYGGTGVIGRGAVDWNRWPGVQAKLLLVEESHRLPALAVGIDTQGRGRHGVTVDAASDRNRYDLKSPGAFVVLSRNWALLGDLSLHGGVLYSLERADGDADPSVWVGIEKSVGPTLAAVAEYDLAFNDNRRDGGDRGYLHAGVRWQVVSRFLVELDVTNLLRHGSVGPSGGPVERPSPSRELRIAYCEMF